MIKGEIPSINRIHLSHVGFVDSVTCESVVNKSKCFCGKILMGEVS